MFKRKLFKHALSKHALPIILSVAMVFQSMPATALAAEDIPSVETTAEVTDETTDDEAVNPVSGDSEQPDAPQAGDQQQNDNPDTPANSEGSNEPASDAPASSEGSSESSEPAPEAPSTPDETPVPEEGQEEIIAEEVQEVNAEAAALDTVINIEKTFYDLLQSKGFKEVSANSYTTTYTGDTNKFSGIATSLDDNGLDCYFEIEVDGEKSDANDNLLAKTGSLNLKWQKVQADGKTEDVTYPLDTGKYQLVITLDEVPEVCKSVTVKIDFEITPAELALHYDWNKEIAAGTTVGDLKEQIKKEYTVGQYEYVAGGWAFKPVDVKEVELTVIKVYPEGEESKVQTDDVQLKSNVDYKVYFSKLTLAEAISANFIVSSCVGEENAHSIIVSDLTETEVVVEKKDAAKEITVVYNSEDAKDLKKTLDNAINSVKVYTKPDKDSDEEKTEIKLEAGEEPTLVWYTKDIDVSTGIDTNEDIDTAYIPLGEGETPKEAGEYYARYKYAGKTGLYAESESEGIKVTIEPISLLLKPNDASKPVLQAGMGKTDVQKLLASLTYDLYTYTVDATGKIKLADKPTPEGENFWGVSYNEKDKTQYYKPVFELEYRRVQKNEETGEILKDENGKVLYEKDWDTWTGEEKDNEELQASEGANKEIEYRIVFSGYKAVFNANGTLSKKVEITDTTTMEAEKNYLVKADEQTRHTYSDKADELSLVLPVDVKAAAKVEIDITDIISTFKEKVNKDLKDDEIGSEEKPLWKIYDGDALYTARADYKKAKIKEGDAATGRAPKETETLTYTWEYNDGDGWEILKRDDENGKDDYAIDDKLISSLSLASSYRLIIDYTDSTYANHATSKAVYFDVRQQEVIVVGSKATARVGKKKADLEFSYGVYKLPDNSEEKFNNLSDDEKKTWKADFYELYEGKWISFSELQAYINKNHLTWKVQRQEKDDAGNDKLNSDGTKAYVDVEDEEPFVAGYKYRASAYLTIDNANYTNEDKTAETEENPVVYHSAWFDIDLQNLGTEKLAIIVDESKLPKSKTYDGKAIDLTGKEVDFSKEVLELGDAYANGLFKIVKANDHAQEVTLTVGTAEDYFAGKEFDVYYGIANVNTTQSRDSGFLYSGYALDADTYYLGVWFAGNETYADFDYISVANNEYNQDGKTYSFEIKKQPLTIRPVLNTDTTQLVAGMRVSNLYNESRTPFDVVNKDKLVAIDSWMFDYGSWLNDKNVRKFGYYAFDGILNVNYHYDNEAVNIDNAEDYLRYGKTYEVSLSGTLNKDVQNYEVTFEKAIYKVEQRGNASVTEAMDSIVDSVRLGKNIEQQGVSQTITPREGIPFYYGINIDGEEKDGNFFAFRIYAPTEYTDSGYYDEVYGEYRILHKEYTNNYENFIYKNAIKNAGGYVLDEFGEWDRYITVLFDVTDLKDLTDKTKTFSICWEDGYVETFTVDLSNAVLEDNLKKAVDPKSLAFNGISTKMVIGEEQNLDVKITKVQLGDIISIAYETDAPDVLSVDEKTGHVTALDVSKPVTVTAYAYRLDKNGEKERLTKKATAKITVTDVTAPAIKKIDEIRDGGAKIHFTKVDNGYRRELYVLEGTAKTNTIAAFESEIAKLEKGQSNNLVKTDYNVDQAESAWGSKTKTVYYTLTGLDKEKDYTVYIRNVSAVRTLADGSSVKPSTKGAVKAFKTTKPQVTELVLYSEDKVAEEIIWAGKYEVSLSSKKVQMTTGGIYKDYGEFADSNDVITWVLPTKVKDVVNPKLTYKVYDYVDGEPDYSNASKYATVSNKGLLTLKGTGLDGYAKVQVLVESDNKKYATCDVIITATPDKVTAKPAKLKVGDTIKLSDYLNYTQGKTKVLNYISSGLEITNREELEEQGIKITGGYEYPSGANMYYTPYYLTAEKDGKFDVKVKDFGLESPDEVTVKLTVSKLDSVKSLKTAYVDDRRITINFAHAGTPSDFLITVEDGRGDLVSRKLVSAAYRDVNHVGKEDPTYQQEPQRHVVTGLTYFEKTKTYAYTIDTKKLVRQSSYKITVTAMYGDTEAKPISTKTKTTNIPASYNNLARYSGTYYGGNTINVTVNSNALDSDNGYSISKHPYFISGNTYTLMLRANNAATTRVTDTLTWKSTNTKVATVKANAGTYNATLKALKYGETTIEVTSKITKKVIARYLIGVNPVNNAGNYYGDYEDEWFRAYDPLYNGTVEVLTLSNSVKVEKLNSSTLPYTWVAFTAPTFGQYTFTANRNLEIYNRNQDVENTSYNTVKFLESGQKIYIKVYGDFELSAKLKEFAKLTVGSSIENAAYNTPILFTAPEDNYYTFNGVQSSIKVIQDSKLLDANLTYDYTNNKYGRGMKAGESILVYAYSNSTISVEKRNFADGVLAIGGIPAKATLTNDSNEKWFKFIAPATGEFTFTIVGADDTIFYKSNDKKESELEQWNATLVSKTASFAALAKVVDTATGTETETLPNKSYELKLSEGDSVYLKLTINELPEGTTEREVSISVSQPEVKALTDGPNTVTAPADGDVSWRSYEAKEGYYTFAITDKDDKNPSSAEFYDSSMKLLTDAYGNNTHDTYNLVVPSDKVKAGEKIYLKITGNATVKITKVEVKAELKVGTAEKVELTGESGKHEYWYTFTAPHKGDYTFRFAIDKKDGYQTRVAGNYLILTKHDEIFSEGTDFSLWDEDSEDGNKPENLILSVGQKVVFCLKVEDTDKNFKLSGNIYVDDENANQAKPPVGTPSEKPEKVVNGELKFADLAAPKQYTFTASQTTRYAITKTMADKASADVEFDGTTIFSDYTEKNLEKGKTYTITVTPQTTKPSGTVTIKPIVPTALKADGTAAITVKKDATTPSWYVFNVPTAGRYNLPNSTGTLSINCYTDFDDNYRNEISGDAKKGYYLEANTKIYIKATSNDTTAEQKADFKPTITLKDLVLKKNDEAGQAITITKNTTDYYKYTVAEEGVYVLTASVPETNGVAANSITYAKNTENNFSIWNHSLDTNGPTTLKFEKGDIIYVRMTADSEANASFTFKLEKRKETELKINAASDEVTLEDGEEAWFSYPVKEDGEFTFKAQDITVPETATLSLYCNNGTTLATRTTDGFYFVKEGTYNTKITFSVTNYSGAQVKFKVHTERVKYAELTEANPVKDVTVQKGELQWMKFTAPEDGRYTFKSDNEDVSLQRLNGTLSTEMPLKKDQTITLYMTYNGTAASAKPTVSVESVKPEAITDKPITVAAGATKWVSYTADKDGMYTFTFKDKEESAQYVTAFDSLADWYGTTDTTITKFLEADSTVYFKLTNGNAEEAQEYILSVEYREGLPVYTIDFTESQTQEITFTAPRDGFYKFNVEGANYFYYYDGNKNSVYCYNNGDGKQFFVMKDETVSLRVTGGGYSNIATVYVLEGDELTDVTELTTDSAVYAAVEQGQSKWFSFTAPSDGMYSFYSSDNNGDPKASLYAGGCSNSNYWNNCYYYCDTCDDDGDEVSNNFVIRYELKAGQKIYLETYHYSHSSAIRYKVNVMYGYYNSPNTEEWE